MKKTYFTIAGKKQRYGHEFMERGMKMRLVKGIVKYVLPQGILCELAE